MPGPPPTPTSQLELRGSWRAKTRHGEPKPEIGTPDKPSFLSEIAAVEWDRVTAILNGLGVLSKIDGDALAMYCETWVLWQSAMEKVKATGSVLKTKNGNPIQNPYLLVANNAAAFCKSMLEQFGMTPSSRSRVTKLPNAKEQTTFPRLKIAK